MEEKEFTIITKDGKEIVLTENRIRDLTSRFIERCGDEAVLYEDFGMNTKMVQLLIDLKKAWYPATQKNLNLNVENFDNKLKTWMEARKELKAAQKEKVFEVVA